MIKYIKYRIGDSHVRFILISSDIQRKWIKNLKQLKIHLNKEQRKEDIDSKFPFDNIKWLVEEGYSVLTLPKSYGGEGATIEDMVVLQSYLGAIDGATALSIGWHLSVVGNYINSICGVKLCLINLQ